MTTIFDRFDERLGKQLINWASEQSRFHLGNPPQLKQSIIRGAVFAFIRTELEALAKECIGDESNYSTAYNSPVNNLIDEVANRKRREVINAFGKIGIDI